MNNKTEFEWISGHLLDSQGIMMGAFAISLSMLVFPLSLYSPEKPQLLLLAIMGYFCAWGFLLSAIVGLAWRLEGFKRHFKKSYRDSMMLNFPQSRLPIIFNIVMIVSFFLLMGVPIVYIYFLPLPVNPVPLFATITGVVLSMSILWGLGVALGLYLFISALR